MGMKNIIGNLTVDGNLIVNDELTVNNNKIVTEDSLSAVAISGSYNDLTNKPTIPAAVTVDSALSSTSTNPVQNKVIDTALANKVDKVSGKGLSTNDFTTTEKEKLAGIAAGANAYTLPAAGSSLGGVKSGGDVTIRNGVITISETSGYIDFHYIDELNTARGSSEVTAVSADGISYASQAEFRDGQAGMSYGLGHYAAQLPIVAGKNISITKNADDKAEISVMDFFAPDVDYTSVTELYKIIGVETEFGTSDYDLSDTKEVGQGTKDYINASAVFYTPGATWPIDLGTSQEAQELEQLLKIKPCIFTSCQASDPDWKGSILAYRESIWADYGHGSRLYDLWDEYDYNSSYATWSHNDSYGTYKVTIATNSIVTTLNSIPTKTSQLINDSGFLTSAPVTSVNGQTGDITNVVLDNTRKVVIGESASGSSTYDIAIGNGATVSNGDGRGVSVAIGQAAEATSTYCTAVGSAASATAKHATAYGHAANATRDSSTAIGYKANALSSNSTAVGRGSTAETGGQSVAIGYIAKTAASYATAIGSNAQAHSANSTAIGHTAIIPSSDGDNVFQLGNSDISVLRAAVSLTTTSDERDKADIEEVYSALDFVKRLRPVTFVRNSREKYISEENKESDKYLKYGMCDYDKEAHASGTLKGSRRRIGLLAQETQQAMVDIYGTDNYANIINDNFHDLEEKPEDVENKLTLAYANLVPFLISAIKEQQAQIEELKNKLK